MAACVGMFAPGGGMTAAPAPRLNEPPNHRKNKKQEEHKMLLTIVLLYIVQQFNLPTWCVVFTWITFFVQVLRLGISLSKE